MEEVTSDAETPETMELCWIVMNTFPNLMVLQYSLLVLLQLLSVTKHSVAVNWILRWKVLLILRKDFLLLTCSSEQLHFLFGSFVRLLIFFLQRPPLARMRAIVNTCSPYVLVFSPIHYGFHFHGHQSWNMFNCNFIRWKFNFVSINSQTRSQSTQRRFITEKRHINLITAMVTSCVLCPTSCWSWLSMLTMGGPGGKVLRSPFKCTLARNAVCHLGEETTCKWRL